MTKSQILCLSGIRDDGQAYIRAITPKGPQIYTPGATNFFPVIKHPELTYFKLLLDANPTSELHIPENICLVINEITEADACKKVLYKAQRLIEQLQLPVINPPHLILKTTRDKNHLLLQEIKGLIVPKTVRFQPRSHSDILESIKSEGFEYPVIIRECGKHRGFTTYLISSSKEMNALFALPLDGREYYLTQYVPCHTNGLYQKHRLVIIDGQIFVRNIDVSTEWMVHYHKHKEYKRHHAEAINQEAQNLAEFENHIKAKIQPTVKAIYKKIPLDFFGIDCFITPENQMVLFELNASMQIVEFDHDAESRLIWDDQVRTIRKAMHQLIDKKRAYHVKSFSQ